VRFYSNENFPRPVVEALRSLGNDVLTSLEAGLANQRVGDPEVLAHANSLQRVLLTLNRSDFRRLHRAGQPHHGIVACTADPDFERQAERIHDEVVKHPSIAGLLLNVTKPG
jgi:hypothetical protein